MVFGLRVCTVQSRRGNSLIKNYRDDRGNFLNKTRKRLKISFVGVAQIHFLIFTTKKQTPNQHTVLALYTLSLTSHKQDSFTSNIQRLGSRSQVLSLLYQVSDDVIRP